MRSKVALLLLFVCVAAVGYAQKSVTLRLPDVGDRVAFAAKGWPSAPPASPVKLTQQDATVPLAGSEDHVFVWDKKTGNLATEEIEKITSGWTVALSSYADIAQVHISVEFGGKPVAAANVTLDDGRRTQTQLLDPSNKGVVEFFAVKPGELKVTVNYKSAGKAAAPVTQVFNSPLQRTQPIPEFKLSVAEQTETVGGVSTPATTPSTPSAPASPNSSTPDQKVATGGNILGTLLVWVVSVIIAVGVGYGVFRYLRDNADKVAPKLEQLGVQIPKPGDEPLADPGPAPMPAKPEPPQKIMLGADATPEPLSAIAPVTAPVVSTTGPSLVSADGTVIPLMPGETIVGREVGVGLSLPNESTLSRRHATLTLNSGQVTVRDEGSTNGTFLNGAKVEMPMTLRPGDTVQFGAVRFRYEG